MLKKKTDELIQNPIPFVQTKQQNDSNNVCVVQLSVFKR